MAGIDDLELDAADAQPIAFEQVGIGEGAPIETRIRRPAAHDAAVGAAEDEAMQRAYAAGAQSQRAVWRRPDRTLGRRQPHDLAAAR